MILTVGAAVVEHIIINGCIYAIGGLYSATKWGITSLYDYCTSEKETA